MAESKRSMKRFILLTTVIAAVQLALWLTVPPLAIWFSPRFDFLGVLIFLYWPTIKLFELTGHYVGEASIMEPLIRGILLGIPINAMIVAAVVCLIKKRR